MRIFYRVYTKIKKGFTAYRMSYKYARAHGAGFKRARSLALQNFVFCIK
jgi:hypothetical protein